VRGCRAGRHARRNGTGVLRRVWRTFDLEAQAAGSPCELKVAAAEPHGLQRRNHQDITGV
jgi:hypothetical protein